MDNWKRKTLKTYIVNASLQYAFNPWPETTFSNHFLFEKENESKNDDCKLKNSKLRIGWQRVNFTTYEFFAVFFPDVDNPDQNFFKLSAELERYTVEPPLLKTVRTLEHCTKITRFLTNHYPIPYSLATLDKILWEAVKSGVACIGCKCGQCLNVQIEDIEARLLNAHHTVAK